MDLNFSLCFAVLLVLLVSIASAQGNNTATKGPLLYTVQPVSQYSCNPHSNGSIQLVCALYQQGGLSNHTIRWIRSFGNIETEMIINETNPSNEDYLISILQPIEAEGPSDYWCQAGVYGEANSTYKPSAVFRVLPPDAYAGYPPCTGLFLSQQVSMFVGNGSILTPLGIIGTSTTMGSTDTPTTVGPSPSSEQDFRLVLIVGAAVTSFFVALLLLLICIFCCVLKSKRKLSTKINLTNKSLQSLTVIDIHGNEPTTSPQEMENSDDYVDVSAEGISPLDHPLRTSLANSMDSAHLQDNATEIYHTIDTDGLDESDYTDLRKLPPISPKPGEVTSQSVNCQQAFAVKGIGGGETSEERRKPLPLPKNKDKNGAPNVKDESLLQSQQPHEQEYQELSSSTKDYMEVLYTCPAELSASPSSESVYAN